MNRFHCSRAWCAPWLAAALAAACSSSPKNGGTFAPGEGSGGGTGFTGGANGNTGNFGSLSNGSGGSVSVAGDGGRPEFCDDAGNCHCFNIASLGALGTWGGTTSALMSWLNTESSASVAVYTTKPTIDAAFLAQYQVIIVQLLADAVNGPYWSFSASEISALSDWVKAGGGLITMSGYQPDAAEVAPLNQLLSFTDISYNTDDILGACPAGQNCACWGNTVPVGPWVVGPIGQNVTQVGAYHGRSINPGSATIDASSGSTVFAAHEDIGTGHLFAWCDEWVTYTSQWLGTTGATGGAGGAGAPNAATPGCSGMTATDVFQVPQFWYNAISYASQATSCTFTINNPAIVPK
ncbi:MAG: hypothetical protein FWD17_04475 [Polyangiaceae bacterium]|nr:hypothetical protein [Polyangiaceae bacterium]